MKKLFTRLLLVALTTSFFVGCSKLDNTDPTPETVKVSVGLKINKIIPNNGGADLKAWYNPEGEEEVELPYCDEKITEGYVVMEYTGVFKNAEGGTVTPITSLPGVIEYAYTGAKFTENELNSGLGQLVTISELQQFDFPTDAETLDLTVTSFVVYKDNTKAEVLFATPTTGSAYDSYVTTPVERLITIDKYEKQYINMDVLCFQKEDLPLFGFAWTDFNVITVNEVCMFFNCLGNTAATKHQVYAANFTALFNTETVDSEGNKIWEPYWGGENYTAYTEEGFTDAEIVPFCIPLPANWQTEGMKVEVTPMGSDSPSTTLTVTSDQIEAFLAETPTHEVFIAPEATEDYYLSLDLAGGIPYLHYTFEDCQKPDAYYANITTNTSPYKTEIYGVNYDGTDVSTAPFFEITGYVGHIAVTPDETTIIIGDALTPTKITLLDLYTLKTTEITEINGREWPVDENGQRMVMNGNKVPAYQFVQFVYIDNQLYAGCKSNNCLVPINILDDKNFEMGPDLIEMVDNDAGNEDLTGGDLLAAQAEGVSPAWSDHVLFSFTGNASNIVKYTKPGDVVQDEIITGVDLKPYQMTGVAILSKTTAITSHKRSDGTVIFHIWENGQKSTAFEKMPSVWGGDMASSWNDEITVADINTIFGI